MKKNVHIVYYALLRQERGKAEEHIQSEAKTLRDLYAELKSMHAFTLAESQIKVAVNAQVSSWEAPLNSGDSIMMIPPVAGG